MELVGTTSFTCPPPAGGHLSSYADSDSDGLPDAWEIQFFGNLDQGAGGDPDGDGVNNLTEFRQGRHPLAGAVADTNNVLKLNVITPLR